MKEFFNRLGASWKRVPAAVRKPIILIIGSLVVIGGLLLIPLPGPGWVVVFAGLALLATEFAAAEKLRDWTLAKLKKIINKARNKPDATTKKPPKA